MPRLRHGAGAALWLLVLGASPAFSDGVTLTTRDGSLSVTGRLLGYDGAFYRLDTEFGEVTVDGSRMRCAGEACPDPASFVARLRISGSAAVGEILLPALIETFAVRRGLHVTRLGETAADATFEFRAAPDGPLVGSFALALSTSDEGFADLIADEADLVVSRREISRDELLLAWQAGRGDLDEPGRARILALDGIVPSVAVENPVQSVSIDALREVIEGRVTDWAALGGEAGPIALHVAGPGSGLFQAFLQRVTGRTDLVLPPGTVVHPTDAQLSEAVADDPGALGLSAFSALGNAQPLGLEGRCGMRIEADVATLKSEDYPLTAPIFVYSPMRRLAELAQAFVDYASSPAAQPVIRRTGYVDQFPQAIPLGDQGQRLAYAIERAGDETTLEDLQRLVRAMDGRVRLSLSFRFEGGSARLDAQSRSNVALLAEALKRGVFDDRRLTFAGFSDGDGGAATNLRLSRERAAVVRDAVENAVGGPDADRITLDTLAFGETLPMACDRSDWGARVNRRVEVWLE